MPADEFTNVPAVDTADSVNVILLDALNTQNADQVFVRSQMNLRKKAPANTLG